MRRAVGDLSTQGKGMRRTVEEAHARHAEKIDWQSGQVRGKGQASSRACCAILDLCAGLHAGPQQNGRQRTA